MMSSTKARKTAKQPEIKIAPKVKSPITPEKQAYLDRCAKRKKILAKKKRPAEKVRIYTPPVKGEAPFAYMVERGPKQSKQKPETEAEVGVEQHGAE
jgi:hypothetical protein